MKLLRLGRTDAPVSLSAAEKRKFLTLYHHPVGFPESELRFRDDSCNEWREWEQLPGDRIKALTHRLQAAGFMPHAAHDGIFGYVTQAAVRLFQEYVRTTDLVQDGTSDEPPSWPDGIVGNDTLHHLDRWEREGKRSRWSDGQATPDYEHWFSYLNDCAAYYRDHPTSVMQHLLRADRRGDSLVPEDWQFDPAEPHLIAFRSGASFRLPDKADRSVDDLFVLLINGKSFYFWGSVDADPSPKKEGYLVEGQHRYRFDWHNISGRRRTRIYKAGRPAGEGVMVIRDVHGHNAPTPENRRDGFDRKPNPTFNIHWSGLGISNWSAGCQVISGRSYLNDLDELIDCTPFTARRDQDRGGRRVAGGPRLTMGAYTLLSDLLLTYTRPQEPGIKPIFRYTLLPEETCSRVPGKSCEFLRSQLDRLRAVPH
ncbi:hypothetical protein GGR28_000332 [Lewinella aquimaris]|uniref:Peptidoglycan binding-like domain-containing protein n=1 Tax=Neolewinella aquimaris TaxID=1835722 RepID=A0A840DXL5_9BACT|nr:peptidoglycan-binding domain-containing protein [Neolewinella aquimaris]MBB4077731.1 hypothetical protein [Neolewinella aquimaris]